MKSETCILSTKEGGISLENLSKANEKFREIVEIIVESFKVPLEHQKESIIISPSVVFSLHDEENHPMAVSFCSSNIPKLLQPYSRSELKNNYVYTMCTRVDQRRKGCCKQLISNIIESFTESTRVLIATETLNELACKIYSNFGFVCLGKDVNGGQEFVVYGLDIIINKN